MRMDHNDDDTDDPLTIGTLTLVDGDSKANGEVVVYSYAPDDTNDTANAEIREFGFTPEIDDITGDQTLSVTAMLYPMAEMDAEGNKSDLSSVLSFDADPVAPEDGKGDEWLVLSECVTYLLYPFVTCGATAGWSTGISVSNTPPTATSSAPSTRPRSKAARWSCTDSRVTRSRLLTARSSR